MKKTTNKATAISPANIAFIKFWGKKNPRLNLPFNNSISMNMGNCLTTTTVEFNPRFRSDKVIINGKEVNADKKNRVLRIMDIIRDRSGVVWCVKVVSRSNFPADAGIASSASAFSALALAGSVAAGQELSQKDLSILARLGSGSASRSVVDGFAEWLKGKDNGSSYAEQIAAPDFWDLVDIVAVVEKGEKKKSSTEGHAVATSSPFYKTRQKLLSQRIREMKKTLLRKNLKKFGELLEEEAVELHVIAMTSTPPVFYWNKGTMEVINKLRQWREEGIQAYFTMDAGPNVHVICRSADSSRLNRKLKSIPEVYFTITNKASVGSRLSPKHLF